MFAMHKELSFELNLITEGASFEQIEVLLLVEAAEDNNEHFTVSI